MKNSPIRNLVILMVTLVCASCAPSSVATIVDPNQVSGTPTQILVDSQSRILVIGLSPELATSSMLVARFSANGSLDTSFGQSGSVKVSLTDFAYNAAQAALDHQGRIVIASPIYHLDSNRQVVYDRGISVARFTSDGVPDEGFGTHGVLTFQGPDSGSYGNMLMLSVDSTDGILLAARTFVTNGATLYKFSSAGVAESSFGTSGVTTFTQLGTVKAIQFNSNNQILLAGSTVSGNSGVAGVARLTSTGAPDTTFATAGLATGVFSSIGGIGSVLKIDSAGNVLVAGPGVISRLDQTGALDTTFGVNGIMATLATSALYSLSIDAEGNIIILGASSTTVSQGTLCLLKLSRNGVLNISFGIAGVQSPGLIQISDVATDSGSNIFVSGLASLATPYLTFTQFLPNGDKVSH